MTRSEPSAAIPLIPRRVLNGNPDRLIPQLSPDGARLLFLAPWEGVLNVWIGPATDPASAAPVTHDVGRGIRNASWAFTGRHVLYLHDTDGNENAHLYCIDLENSQTTDLTPFNDVAAQLLKLSPRRPDQALVGLNRRDPRFHDVYRVSFGIGELTMVQLNDAGMASFICDEDLRVRLGVRITSAGGAELAEPLAEGQWLPRRHAGIEDAFTTHAVGFDRTGGTLYLLDSRGRNTAALVAWDIASDSTSVLAEDETADISGVLLHPVEQTVQAAYSTYDRLRWQFLDAAIADEFRQLAAEVEGDVQVVSRSLDDRRWLIAGVSDRGRQYFLVDRPLASDRAADPPAAAPGALAECGGEGVRRDGVRRDLPAPLFLFDERTSLRDLPLARMAPVIIPARDGLGLVSYLTLPPAGPAPAPLVLIVHGGPWHRDFWGCHPWHQWLANRGYAVLSVNYRGSIGFGKAFINAGNREWGGRMQDDLVDAVTWAVENGIARADRTAIMGGSYGGYATLVGLTRDPELFACGVDLVGISDLVTFMETIPAYWTPGLGLLRSRVGDPTSEEGRAFLKSRSPLSHAAKIKRPLLIGQGANDPRVKKSESDQIVSVLQEKGIPVTYVIYPDEGHGLARPQNRLSFDAIIESFLAEHLGGRLEPIGSDFRGSSLTVPAGAHYIKGLTEALEAGRG